MKGKNANMDKSKKTERIELRLSEEEKKNIAYHSQLMNISMSEYILLNIRRKRIVICENFPELIYQISHIGNNINQIAAIANKNDYISEKNINEAKHLMGKCYDLIQDIISIIAEPADDYVKSDPSLLSDILSDIMNNVKSLRLEINDLKNKID
ncbi:MAG: plasmid mobilization relaxosome protein MobC [Ruminococcus sp.]|nr:plasmid mobilization relaxosome protein MobC [Ruminococcus sp.]